MLEAVAPIVTEWPRPLAWLREFLKEELAPYSGRGLLVARMVIAATLVMLITMTFRLPFAYQAIFALIVSRETHRATTRTAWTSVLSLVPPTGYLLVGTMISLGDPMLRTLWIIASLFIGFLGIRVIADYTSAVGFGNLVAISIPILDQHISTEEKVKQTLWAAGVTVLAAIIAALVAMLFAGLKPRDFLFRSIAERLASVEDFLRCYGTGQHVENDVAKKITRMAMLGTSSLRRNIQRSGYSPHYAEQMGVVIALVGRLVDISATLVSSDVRAPLEDRNRIQTLAQNIANLRANLLSGRIPRLHQASVDSHTSSTMPVLGQMERTVSLISEVFVDAKPLSGYAPPLSDEMDPPQSLFVRDALTNPEHIKFALKGCLAATLCYIIYSALDWRGISTAVVTCVLTALTTIGSSRQKQILRFSGAIAGATLGLAAQVFVVPSLDSITGFTILFIIVTSVAAWIATSSPRLSYFGVQFALAFYVIHLRDFSPQRSLVPGRDRVVGIMLGLFMMWLVFDQLWSAPTVVQMRKAFISQFRLLAQLIKQPLSDNSTLNVARSYSLRETINGGFNQVRALADAVWFEFGPSRHQDLALRSRILGWQAQLRMLFIISVSLAKYRLRFPGFELPEPVRRAENEFEESLAHTLDAMADRLEGKALNQGQHRNGAGTASSPFPKASQKDHLQKVNNRDEAVPAPHEDAPTSPIRPFPELAQAREGTQDLETAFARLTDSVKRSASTETPAALSANLQSFLPLSQRIAALAVSLDKEISS